MSDLGFPMERELRNMHEARERRIAERDELAKVDHGRGLEWSLKFVSQWAILSGGTLTLIVTFVQSRAVIVGYHWFLISSILISISLILSALHMFFRSEAFLYNARWLSGLIGAEGEWN
jgi:hypothetical protein